jgi:Na+/phosphate symporter
MSPDVPLPATTSPDSPTIANSTSGNSTGVISVGGLVAAVLGSIIGTAIISFMTGYWVIKRKQFSKNELLIKNDPVNVQVIYG